MRRTRKQRLIAMRKAIDYSPHHPKKYVLGGIPLKRVDFLGNISVLTEYMRIAPNSRRKYQTLKKQGV